MVFRHASGRSKGHAMTGPTIGQQLDATLANLATKQDLERFATKEDLKNFATKDDIADLKADIKAEMKAYVTHDQLNIIIKAAVHELVQVINQNTEDLREDLNSAGVKIRTKVRGRGSYSAE
jgi:hypothetical protein